MRKTRVEILDTPVNQIDIDAKEAQGYEFLQCLGPVSVWHSAGGLPGGLHTKPVYYAYFKEPVK